jgi:PelA/Pel-15E family pectate lyase
MNRWFPLLVVAILPTIAFSEPVTTSGIELMPAGEQAAWQAYLERSQASAMADQAALKTEVAANKMTNALRAPSGGDFKLSAKSGDAWYASDEAKALADVMLSYQTPAGGWSKHTGYSEGIRKPGMQWTSQNEPGKKPHYLGTFDNHSTTEQMNFLANVWLATQREDCKAGFIKGLNYIFAAQYPNGGWPQVYPLEGDYHDDITFNDDAMTHILDLLQSIADKDPCHAFLDEAMRGKAAVALEKGMGCVFKMQVVQDGKKTAWCAQYDPFTLQPAQARKMEPATLSGQESANLLKFLMTIPHPTPELVASIESGLEWLDRVKVTGLARTKREGKTVYEPDSSSTEVYWARFYSLTDSKPVFPGRDGVLYPSYNEMAANNKLGYDFFSPRPGSVVNNGQKKWRKMIASSKAK